MPKKNVEIPTLKKIYCSKATDFLDVPIVKLYIAIL